MIPFSFPRLSLTHQNLLLNDWERSAYFGEWRNHGPHKRRISFTIIVPCDHAQHRRASGNDNRHHAARFNGKSTWDLRLRHAITAVNTQSATNGCAAGTGNDTINFSVTGEIGLSSTLPEISDSLRTINGPASPMIRLEVGVGGRVLQVASGATLKVNNAVVLDVGILRWRSLITK
jgi:hypothetical protein